MKITQFLYFCLFAVILTNTSFAQKSTSDFVTTWQTTNPFLRGDSTITILTDPNYSYNYDVDLNNDGVFDSLGVTGDLIHRYNDTGTYTIRIRGNFPRLYHTVSGLAYNGKIISLDQWGTNAWQNLDSTFRYCVNLVYNATDTPNLSNVNSLIATFFDCRKFNANLSNWNFSGITSLNSMLSGCHIYNQPVNSWDVSNVTDLSFLFHDCFLFNQPVNNWNVSKVTTMRCLFFRCYPFNQPLNNWDMDSVKNTSCMLSETSFNLPLDLWDVSSDTSMAGMFLGTPFNHPLNNWDVSNVQNIHTMFTDAAFNLPLDNWDVSNVYNMGGTFAGASFNQPLDNWDVSNVRNMRYMFSRSNYNLSLSNWDISSVRDMGGMFRASVFNQPLNSWDVDSVYFMNQMFYDSQFNQPLDLWKTDNTYSMSEMFRRNKVFNQDIGNFNITKIFNQGIDYGIRHMLDSTNLSKQNYDSTLIKWSLQNKSGLFLGAAGLEYCLADSARNRLLAMGWGIVGDSLNCLGVGINEAEELIAEQSTIKVYPNPTSGRFTLEIDPDFNKAQIVKIYTSQGKLVLSSQLSNAKTKLDLSNEKAGLYFIQVEEERKKILIL